MKLDSHANIIESAVLKTISEGKVLTRDLGGKSTGSAFTTEVCRNVKA
jgi:isocitrate dehydrogenase (NAD+)